MYGINNIGSKCRLPSLNKTRTRYFCQALQEVTRIRILENANKLFRIQKHVSYKSFCPLGIILPTFLRFYAQVNGPVRTEHRNVGLQLYHCVYSANFGRPYQQNST
jgi:hypothetical protein